MTSTNPGKPLLFIVFLVLSVLASPARCDISVITSPHDTRRYAALELPNRLKVLVISDPITDKAAAALDVFAGSNADPENRPGLAHFLEHMLFLGTRKYPGPDAFQMFIAKHAGEQNAYTGFAHTNYFFDVDARHLREALDRFGQFFIAPIFSDAYADRERSAVDAEFHTKKKNDTWRKMETIKQVMNPRHPFSRFTIGDLETFSDGGDTGETPIRQDLMALYGRYYSANLMALTVLGKEPVEVLAQWVKDVFSAIPDFDAKPPRTAEPMFTSGRLPTHIILRPVQELRQLTLLFPVPAPRPHYKTKPLYYISHIIGHEGKGSLLSLLKERGWAEALSAGIDLDHPDSAAFGVSISLTEKGIEKTDAIVALVFQTIGVMEVRESLFEEISRLADIDFLFQEKSPPMDYVSHLANALHEYPMPEVLRGPLAMDHYDEALIRRYLSALTPDNVLVMVVRPDAEETIEQETIARKTVAEGTITRETVTQGTIARGTTVRGTIDQETTARATSHGSWLDVPRFGARYKQQAIAPDTLHAWWEALAGATVTSRITMPAPNIFIPRDLSLKHVSSPGRPLAMSYRAYSPRGRPARIIHVPGLSVWFRQDTTYGVPRADLYFSVRSQAANDTPRHSVMTRLFVALVRDRLTEFVYPASLAGLDYELYPHIRGLSVRISGYHDKQKLLLTRIVDTLRETEFQAERFQIAKRELIRKLRNVRQRMPYQQALLELRDILLQPHWSPEIHLAALRPVTLSDLHAFLPELFGRISLVALSHGNVHEADALDMVAPLQGRLISDALPTRVPHGSITELAEGTPYLRTITPDHDDSVAIVYFQGQRRGFRELARMALLGQILKTPFFHQLRTEQELGYVVLASTFPILRVPGLLFLVQSPDSHPSALTTRIREFLAGASHRLADMSEAEFARHKSALITRILAREENLGIRSERYWEEIDFGIEGFDSRRRKADAARAITLTEVREMYRTRILGEHKRQLIIHAVGNRHRRQQGNGPQSREGLIDPVQDADLVTEHLVIEDPALFKQGQNTF
uniref:Protease 3 n=1 Tax=Candidatus Kentrum sp. LFY TaxID=2126342 RepID=A0A450V6B6_9GAMM|nr:MAG: insulysin [Candidatus Kentron sp. LFY]